MELNVSQKWIEIVMQRHPVLSYRKTKKVNGSRAKNLNCISVIKWFKVWKDSTVRRKSSKSTTSTSTPRSRSTSW